MRLETWVDSVELRLESGSPGWWGCEWDCDVWVWEWDCVREGWRSDGEQRLAAESRGAQRPETESERESWRWEWENESVRSENWDRDRVCYFFPSGVFCNSFFFFFLNFGLNWPVRCRYQWLRPIRTDSAWIDVNQLDSVRVSPTLCCVGAYRAEEKKKKGTRTDTQAAVLPTEPRVRPRRTWVRLPKCRVGAFQVYRRGFDFTFLD